MEAFFKYLDIASREFFGSPMWLVRLHLISCFTAELLMC